MFTAKQTEDLKKQLYEISGELYSQLKETDQEIWWPTPFYINADDYDFKESYDLFNGNCGIILFFLALYKFDKNISHLNVVHKGMHRILNAGATQKLQFFALYTGLGGIIYTCLKVFEVTGNVFYKEKALTLALIHQQKLTLNLLKTDILSGYTGNLLLLTLLYHHTNHQEVLNMVCLLIDRLIAEARISIQGLKWDYSRSKKAYDSMTGFSHGASGIAWVLMQVGQYFNAAGLIYLAEEALAYEMQYFHQPAKNWLDLRLGPHRLNKPDVHEWKLETFLPEMTNVNAWAHGAAGIGITRQMALTLTKKRNYKKDCKNILDRCLNDLAGFNRTDFTLVSGYCGMIPFLLNCDMESQIVLILDQARKLHRKTNSYNGYVSCGCDDYGLLSGKAGIGYIILNVLLDKNMDSILAPELPKRVVKIDLADKYSQNEIKKAVFSKYYTRTLEKLKAVNPAVFDVEDISDFNIRLKPEVLKVNNTEIKEIFDLESRLIDLWKQHKGYFSLEQKRKFLHKMASESLLITDQALMGKSFSLNQYVKLYRYKGENDLNILLLIIEEKEIRELKIGAFAAMILNAIEKEKTKGAVLLKSLQPVFFEGNPTDKSLVELGDKVVKQIRLLIKAGFVEISG